MANFNQVTLLGNVGRTPDVRTFESGSKVANFSLATTFRYKNAAGELTDETTWHNIVAHGKLADTVEVFVKSGQQVLVNGRIRVRKYTNAAGEEKSITEIVANAIQLIGGRTESGSSAPASTPAAKPSLKAIAADEGDGLPF